MWQLHASTVLNVKSEIKIKTGHLSSAALCVTLSKHSGLMERENRCRLLYLRFGMNPKIITRIVISAWHIFLDLEKGHVENCISWLWICSEASATVRIQCQFHMHAALLKVTVLKRIRHKNILTLTNVMKEDFKKDKPNLLSLSDWMNLSLSK